MVLLNRHDTCWHMIRYDNTESSSHMSYDVFLPILVKIARMRSQNMAKENPRKRPRAPPNSARNEEKG